MNRSLSKLHIFWILPIVFFALFIKFYTINPQFLPIENAFISQAINYKAENIIDKYSINITPIILKHFNLTNLNKHYKILSLLISIIQLFLLYKLTYTLFGSKVIALLSVFLALLQAPLIFISQLSTNDIVALTFFTLFLWHFSYSYKEKKFDKILWIILISFEFTLSVLLNYILFFLAPVCLIILFKVSKKSSIIFLLSFLIILIMYYFLYKNVIFIQLQQILDTYNLVDIKFYKILTRMGELIILPFMLLYAAWQIQWKSPYRKEFYYTFLVSAIIIPLISILLLDVYNFYRLSIYAIVILLPINAYIFRKFLEMNIHYKYSVIIISIFMLLFSFWTLTKFQSSYPDMSNLKAFIENNISLESKIYSEDHYFIDTNIHPISKRTEIDKYYVTKQNKTIINYFVSGYYDIIILNDLLHNKLNEKIRNKYLKNYNKIYSEEFKTNSLLFPQTEGLLEIYVLKELNRINLQLLTSMK